jgi:hypothetical protein
MPVRGWLQRITRRKRSHEPQHRDHVSVDVPKRDALTARELELEHEERDLNAGRAHDPLIR